jgi:putative MATE family efflux protein
LSDREGGATPPAPHALPASLSLPVPQALLRLALPILASQALRLAFQWVDALWVRGLGTSATAAITTSVFVMWCVLSLNDVFGMGISAYVSQLVGAGDRARAGVAAWKGIRASALMGLVGTALGLFGARAIFRLMDPGGTVVEEGAAYLGVVLLAAPVYLAAETCESVLRAAGDTRTPFLVELGAVAFNALLAPLLIYGPGPFPALGIAGAAWATVGAHVVRLSCYAVLALRRYPSFPLARRAPGPPVRISGMARVGIPAAMIGLLFSAVYISFVRAASAWGAAAVAVVGIGNRLEAIEFVIAVSLGLAGASVLGQSLGAGRPERAAEVVRTAQRWAMALSFVLLVVFLAWPRQLLSWFSPDPAVWEIGVPYLRVLALTLPFTALEIATAEAVMGSGHTAVLSWIYTTVSLARIPLAFLVPRWTHSGALGIVWLITISCMVRTIAILLWVGRGTWKRGLASELHAREPGAPETPGGAC